MDNMNQEQQVSQESGVKVLTKLEIERIGGAEKASESIAALLFNVEPTLKNRISAVNQYIQSIEGKDGQYFSEGFAKKVLEYLEAEENANNRSGELLRIAKGDVIVMDKFKAVIPEAFARVESSNEEKFLVAA